MTPPKQIKTMGEMMTPAPTARMIEDVEAAYRVGLIPMREYSALLDQLKCGGIEHPIWEDYGLRTNPYTGLIWR